MPHHIKNKFYFKKLYLMNMYFAVVVNHKDGTTIGSRGEPLVGGQLLGPGLSINFGSLIKSIANGNPLS
jgi:hypothetical protein